jgi:hypothetical protein
LEREPEPGAARPRAFSRLGSRRVLLGVGLLALLFAVGLVVTVLRIKQDLDRGREALAGLSLERLEGGLTDTITQASSRLDRAHDRAEDSVFLKPLTIFPVLGDHVDALRDLTGTASEIGAIGRRSASAIEDVLDRSGGDPLARLELLATAARELDRVETAVEDVDVGAEGRLVGPLSDARATLVQQLDEVPERFEDARAYLTALTTLLAGPSKYLVLAANNAEMRAGAGMPLQAGLATIEAGDISFGQFVQLANLRVPGTPGLLPGPWHTTYRNFKMGRSWVQTAVSPVFTSTAPVWAEMSAQSGSGPVDGVIEVDPIALRSLLEVIGPVEVDGTTYTSENIEAKLLYENYLEFDTVAERRGRQEKQGEVAQAIFDALKTRDIDIAELAIAMREAAEGRHLLAWSRDPGMQRIWEEIGASGEMPESALMVAVQNIAANKLDYFIEPRVTITAHEDTITEDWRVRVTVSIENPADAPTNDYIDGTHPDYRDGLHRAMVTLYMPGSAYNYRAIGGEVSEAGEDPPLQMVAQRVLVEKGETARPSFEFYLPDEHVGALVMPSARVEPQSYEVNGIAFDDRVPIPVLWVQADDGEQSPGAPAVAGALSLAGALAVLAGTRTRMRYATLRPLRPVPDLAQRALPFAFVLFLAAGGALVAGWLISSAQ